MGTISLQLTPEEVTEVLGKGKTCVIKDHPCGKAGDRFFINGRAYELIDVSERSLDMITRYCHTIDGQPTSADFISKWKATHNGQWYPEAKMYVHWFRDVTPS